MPKQRPALIDPSPARDDDSIADLVRQIADVTGEDVNDLFADASETDDAVRYLTGLLDAARREPKAASVAVAEVEPGDAIDDELLASRGLSIVEKKIAVRELNKSARRWEVREQSIGFLIRRQLPDGRVLFTGSQGSLSHQRDAVPFFERDDAVNAARRLTDERDAAELPRKLPDVRWAAIRVPLSEPVGQAPRELRVKLSGAAGGNLAALVAGLKAVGHESAGRRTETFEEALRFLLESLKPDN